MKKQLLAFLDEMEKNLETFFVMDQRQFITHGFRMEAWPLVKDLDIIKKQEAITAYAGAIEEFNRLFKEQKEYEQWYVSDLKNKTSDNARKLHAMKQELDTRVKAMEAIIIPAGQALEKELLQMGFIAN